MHPCEKCGYWGGKGCRYEIETCCKLPCRPGLRCDFNPVRYVKPPEGEQIISPTVYRRYPKWNLKQALQMYRDGASDIEIAEAVGVKPVTVRSWRNRNRYPSNRAKKGLSK